MNMKRVVSLDVLKYAACLMVVSIHMNLSPSLETVIQPFLTIAVPVFFMITGYFYTPLYDSGKTTKQIKKITALVVIANVLHLGFQFFKHVVNGEPIKELVAKWLDPSAIVQLIIFNQPVWRTSLWYINALLYVLLVVYVVQKKWSNLNKLYPLIPILLVCNLLIGTYSIVLPTDSLVLCYSRNFLFCGLPYFLLGYYIYHNKSCMYNKAGKGIYFIVISAVAYAELLVLNAFKIPYHKDHLLSTAFLSCVLFCMFLNNEEKFNGRVCKVFAELGRKHSFVIYVVHSIIIEVFYRILEKTGTMMSILQSVFEWIGPLVVLMLSTLFAFAIDVISRTVKNVFITD